MVDHIQLNIDYPTTSGQTTVRRCSDKANVPDKKKLSLTHFQWLLLAARPFYFLLFKIFVFFEWLTTCTVRTLRHVRPKKLLRIIEWSDSRCADNRCSTVLHTLQEHGRSHPIQITRAWTSLIRSSFIRIPRHPEENRWLPIYSICHAYIQYVWSIIRFPRLPG